MKIGLIGLQGSGKTTVFNALTKSEASTAHAGGKSEPNVAVVKVMDERVDRLVEIYQPKKTVYATVEFVDFGGMGIGSSKEGASAAASMATMRNMDALALVARNFQDPMGEDPAPLEDVRIVGDELLISDLIVAENRLERIEKGYSRGQRTDALVKEEKLLRSIIAHLNRNLPIRELELTGQEEKVIRGFQFLTNKPLMIIINSSEDLFNKSGSLIAEMPKDCRVIEFAGKFEMELSRLDQDEAALFMEDMGITESAYSRLTRLAYETLGYISFFTVGPDEVRAWNIQRGDTALDAAGTIHTDLARGFIRAECFTYDDLIQHGSEKHVREKGLFRLEGKEYQVKDGDILNIRFNV
ncbi:MAG: redox-regulated ATPase YchF [Desulfobacteraceae bacterium]|nr:MAG: redox-regulated ATPase YchF [Desulfobacteraceae bacterium]